MNKYGVWMLLTLFLLLTMPSICVADENYDYLYEHGNDERLSPYKLEETPEIVEVYIYEHHQSHLDYLLFMTRQAKMTADTVNGTGPQYNKAREYPYDLYFFYVRDEGEWIYHVEFEATAGRECTILVAKVKEQYSDNIVEHIGLFTIPEDANVKIIFTIKLVYGRRPWWDENLHWLVLGSIGGIILFFQIRGWLRRRGTEIDRAAKKWLDYIELKTEKRPTFE